MKLEIPIEEKDVLIINDKQWQVQFVAGKEDELCLSPVYGEERIFEREEVNELIQYSGKVKHIKKDFLSSEL